MYFRGMGYGGVDCIGEFLFLKKLIQHIMHKEFIWGPGNLPLGHHYCTSSPTDET